MSDKNFSWGLLGLILIGVMALTAVIALAFTGNYDVAVGGILFGVTTSVVTAIAGIMNPNRRFDSEGDLVRTVESLDRKLSSKPHQQPPTPRER